MSLYVDELVRVPKIAGFWGVLCLVTTGPRWKEEIQVEHAKDERVITMLQESGKVHGEDSEYTCWRDLISYKNNIFLLPNSKFKE